MEPKTIKLHSIIYMLKEFISIMSTLKALTPFSSYPFLETTYLRYLTLTYKRFVIILIKTLSILHLNFIVILINVQTHLCFFKGKPLPTLFLFYSMYFCIYEHEKPYLHLLICFYFCYVFLL